MALRDFNPLSAEAWKLGGTNVLEHGKNAGKAVGKSLNPRKWIGGLGKVGLVAGAVAAIGIMARNTSKKREYDLRKQHPEPDVAIPTIPEPATTLMGEQLVKNGPLGTRILNQRSGLAAGIDPSNPAIDVDGKPIQDLGAPARI